MKIMCDTNVIIDVLLEREPFVEDSYKILKLCEEHKIDGFVSASSVTDIFYLVRKYTHSTEQAYKAVGKLLEIVKVCLAIMIYNPMPCRHVPHKYPGYQHFVLALLKCILPHIPPSLRLSSKILSYFQPYHNRHALRQTP